MADYTDRIYRVLKNAKRTPLTAKKILFEAKIGKEFYKNAGVSCLYEKTRRGGGTQQKIHPFL